MKREFTAETFLMLLQTSDELANVVTSNADVYKALDETVHLF